MRVFYIPALALVAGCGLAATLPAQAQDDTLQAKTLVATCAACHGTNGRPVAGSVVMGLAGLPKDVIVTQMKAFKSGERTGTVMNQLAKGFSDAQIVQMATYFSAQKP